MFYIEFINGSIILFAEDFVCMVSIPLNLLNFVLLEDSLSWHAFEKKMSYKCQSDQVGCQCG